MGATGSGKSTFINLVSGSNLSTSAGLESCTQDVQVASVFKLDDRFVKLIDTPGFDDINKSEVEILKLIADYLADQYVRGATLHGVLYFHRISDIKMGGVSKRSFRFFRNLCGETTLKNVAIVTSMWDKVTVEEGEAREKELSSDERFFKLALDEKAIMIRHDNTSESARGIIRKILTNHPLPLTIQKEIVDDRTPLHDTHVGKALAEDLQESAQWFLVQMKNLREEIAEAMRERDEKAKQELADALVKSNGDLARIQNEIKNLRAQVVGDVDVEKQWKGMDQTVRIATLFRRSRGAAEAPEMKNFWSVLGDTTKTVSNIGAIFVKNPMTSTLQAKLLESTSNPNQDARGLIEAWIKKNPKVVEEMKTIMRSAIESKSRRKPWYKLW